MDDNWTVEGFLKYWDSCNDWLPRHIVTRINEGYGVKVEGRELMLQDPDLTWRWMTVARRKIGK